MPIESADFKPVEHNRRRMLPAQPGKTWPSVEGCQTTSLWQPLSLLAPLLAVPRLIPQTVPFILVFLPDQMDTDTMDLSKRFLDDHDHRQRWTCARYYLLLGALLCRSNC